MTNEPDTMRCRTCGYDLHRLTTLACPECGGAFDPADRRTFLTQPVSGLPVMIHVFAGLALLAAPLVAAYIVDVTKFTVPHGIAPLGPLLMVGGLALVCLSTRKALRSVRAGLPWSVHRWGFFVAIILGGGLMLTFFIYAIASMVL